MHVTLSETLPLPTRDELLALLPLLLIASGELARPTGGPQTQVFFRLSPAWANGDFEPQLDSLGARDRAYVERQIERLRCHYELEQETPWLWELSSLSQARLADRSLFRGPDEYRVLMLEVPVVTIERDRAVLRGQRQGGDDAEDFEHWLHLQGATWTRDS